MLKQRLLTYSHHQVGSCEGIRWRLLGIHCCGIFSKVRPSPLCFSTPKPLVSRYRSLSGTTVVPLVVARSFTNSAHRRTSRQRNPGLTPLRHSCRYFHDYFTTAVSNAPNGQLSPVASASPDERPGPSTIVRIPLNHAKQHYGSLRSRGTRPYNEDWSQAGVLELPLQSLVEATTATPAEPNSSLVGSPPTLALSNSVFYYSVFDGHGGDECSIFLKTKLHEYIENTAAEFYRTGQTHLDPGINTSKSPIDEASQQNHRKQLQETLIASWREVGGYFKRFRPNFLTPSSTSGHIKGGSRGLVRAQTSGATGDGSWESILTYAFLWADFDYIYGKWRDTSERTLAVEDETMPADTGQRNETIMVATATKPKATKVKSGSTASVALIFTP